MAFLTIIAPLVAITYPIDKINDGKAQAFDLWLKEYIFNLLIQPMHLILYIVLVGSAMEFAAKNIFYVVIALGFLMPAEKLLRRFFGFEKAQTPGMFAGPAGTALMMSGLNKLMHRKPPKGQLGSGGNRDNGDSEDETSEKPPWKDRSFDATENLIGTGGNVENSGDINNENESKLSNKIPYHSNLTSKQIDDLKAQGIEPGDPEYRTALFNYGINPDRNPTQNRKDPSVMNVSSTNKSLAQPKRGRSKRRAIRRATRNYFKGPNGIGRRMINKHKANGGFVKRGIRMAGGVVAGGTLAAAGGIIGIASGDPSKAAQYMAAGAAGGYTLGKGAVNSAADTLKVEGTFEEAKKGYYGDEYSEHQQGKYKKDFIKNEENLKKIEDKLHVERKEAKKIMEDNVQYYLDKEIYDMDDIIATYNLEKEVGRDQAIATAQYANQVMNGEDPTYMTEKRKKEYKDTFIPKFTNNGTRSKEAAEADVNKVFDLVSRFHKFKK